MSVMLSPPKLLDENQPTGVRVTHMNGACNSNFFFAPPPGALSRGQKVKYHLISITRSISMIFIPNFVFFLTNERYKHIRRDFIPIAWVMPLGSDFGRLGVPRGSK